MITSWFGTFCIITPFIVISSLWQIRKYVIYAKYYDQNCVPYLHSCLYLAWSNICLTFWLLAAPFAAMIPAPTQKRYSQKGTLENCLAHIHNAFTQAFTRIEETVCSFFLRMTKFPLFDCIVLYSLLICIFTEFMILCASTGRFCIFCFSKPRLMMMSARAVFYIRSSYDNLCFFNSSRRCSFLFNPLSVSVTFSCGNRIGKKCYWQERVDPFVRAAIPTVHNTSGCMHKGR